MPKLCNRHRKQLFGIVWEDLGGYGNAKCATVTKSTAKGQPKGQPKGAKRGPKITTWTPYERQMAAEAELLQQIWFQEASRIM